MPKCYSYFNRPPQVGFSCSDKSKTQQQFKDESDINYIVRRFGDTGTFVDPTMVNSSRVPTYGDFSNADSFMEQQNAVAKMTQIFESMPSEVRAQFGNNVANFAEYMVNEDNKKRMEEAGLITKDENVNNGVDIKKDTPGGASSEQA